MPTQTKENYLKALYFLSQQNDMISMSELATKMEVSIPTANSMIKKMKDQGWVKYEKYKPIRLTKRGVLMSANVIRKHRLSEMFLVQIMGFGWEEVHAVAEELEHVQSDKFFERMDELMGFPSVDPHGSPIPDASGNLIRPDYVPLSNVEGHKKVKLRALRDSSKDFILFLNKKKLQLNLDLNITSKESFDQSMTISYGENKNMVFSHAVTSKLLVEVLDK